MNLFDTDLNVFLQAIIVKIFKNYKENHVSSHNQQYKMIIAMQHYFRFIDKS